MDTVITRYADAVAILTDPRFGVPAAALPGPGHGMSWLRAFVCRFRNGPDHARRRAMAVADLDRIDVSALRRAAFDWARAQPPGADVIGRAPVTVLATALGFPDPESLVAPVALVAGAYHGGGGADADDAVRALVDRLGPGEPEQLANRIALLVQAHDATATLIHAALARDEPAEQALAAALRDDPPVPALRRVDDAGTLVVLDLPSVNRDAPPGTHLTFGYGPRPCPGSDHALAVAAGVLMAIRENA